MSVAGNSGRPGASVASRVLALLGAFDHDHRAMTLTDLARRAGLPVPTAHRLAGELVAWGALVRRASGEYVVGRRMWDLGLLTPVQSGLRQVASPFLQDLYGATLATVHLAVRDGTSVLYVDRLSGHVSVPVVSQVGTRLPMHATGVGKVLLAHAPQDVQARVLATLTRVTAYTVTQPGRLRAELRRVVRDGFAQTSEEMSLGACSVAVPIRARVDSALREEGALWRGGDGGFRNGGGGVRRGGLRHGGDGAFRHSEGGDRRGGRSDEGLRYGESGDGVLDGAFRHNDGGVRRGGREEVALRHGEGGGGEEAVRHDEGEVVAALGLVVPRLGRDRSRLVAALRVAARGIGRSLDLPLGESR